MMRSILITGCNRGLGLGLIKTLVQNKRNSRIIATCRDTQKAEELQLLGNHNPNLHILELDIRNYDTFTNFADSVSNIVKDDGLNVLFNNAGYSPKSTRINFVTADQMLETLQINTVGPLMLTKALLPLLKKAAAKNADKKFSIDKAAIINMTSILGSIELNSDGGLYPYRCSKAALNMMTKSLSKDLQKDGILVTAVHPGWVKTDMGGSNAPLNIETSVQDIAGLMEKFEYSHHGGFYQYDGRKLPW